MDVARRFSLFLTAGLLGIAVMLGTVKFRAPVSANAARSLMDATSYFDSRIVLARNAVPRGSRGDQLTVALGYLERLRLGLGSPFRLVDQALDDPRLDATMGPRVAWALLGRLRRGDAYVIDASILDGAGPWSGDGRGATGAAHLALIEHAVRAASDPRAGELAVRLAYSIESAKGTLASSTAGLVTQVAALIRDREAATADLRDLLTDASDRHADVLALVTERRASREFRVEQPALSPLTSELRIEAMNAVPALLRTLDTLDRVAIDTTNAGGVARASVLGVAFAARLDTLGAAEPPRAQVGVTLHSRAHVSLRSTNEETLVAEARAAAASRASDSTHRANSLALLSVAVAVRTLAQETPWFPGDAAPTAADLATEFGLADVGFARGVPAVWRPYYLRELQAGLRDMQHVLPAVAFEGLHVRFGVEPLRDSALAMHDPRTRTLQLSIATSGGTLAHELSHDLDWQTARRLFADGRGYSTDRAMRERRGPLASSLQGLATARLLRPVAATGGGVAPSGGGWGQVGRPAELFARGADWFVASSLARQGRMNGFLSAVEDGLLTGYAAGAPAAMGRAGATSLLSAIAEMTYVPDSIRAGFESQWSDSRVIDPALVVRRVIETPVPFRSAWMSRGAAVPIIAATRPQVCVADASAETAARQSLLMLAIDARARGIAARRFRFRRALVTIDDGDRLRDALRSEIIAELATALPDQGLIPLVPSIFRSSAASCSSIAR